jgi:hypothetical protein
MTVSNVVNGFLPSTHGLRFANRFPTGPTVRIGPIALPRPFGVGDAANGLCGGMAWLVRERFEAGQPVPADTSPPANGSPLFNALVRRQVLSLEWTRTPLAFWWMTAFGGPERTARRSRETEWPKIRRRIDSGRLAMVGLVRHRGANPLNLSKSHQVLAYGYTVDGAVITLRIYDPNWPLRDDVRVTLEPSAIRQSTGELLFGVLSLG